ncbi:serine/threonine protein phosphatase [Labilibacter sediminis]|nr:serine/threonine protein phosphatase [Labilibacter sediminis]
MECRLSHLISQKSAKIGCLFLFLSIVLSAKVAALDTEQRISVSTYTIHNGLSGNGITAVFQDSKGLLWIGTEDGLNRYDGYSFKIYRHNLEDNTSISGNYIQSITEDYQGNLWVGTIGSGLNKWVRETDSFVTIDKHTYKHLHFPEENIYALSFDPDSSLWIKTDNYLLNYNIKSSILSSYSLYSTIFKHQESLNVPIVHKSSSHLWVGTNDGISQFNKKDRLYERILFNEESDVLPKLGSVSFIIKINPETTVLGGSAGIYQLEQTEDGVLQDEKVYLPRGVLGAVKTGLRHLDGSIWLGTKKGIFKLDYDVDKQSLGYDPKSYFNISENRISTSEITCFFEDNSGLLWVGTRYDGLLKVNFKPKKFSSIQEGSKKYQGLKSFDIKSIHIDEEERLWLGTADKGLKILDTEKGDVYSYPVNRTLNYLGEDVILSMCNDSKNRIWIGTGQGIYIFYLERGTIREFSYTNSEGFKSLLINNTINAIEEDTEGNIWFGTQFGLYKYNGYEITNYFSDSGNKNSICNDEINALYLDTEGILWIGTSDGVNFVDSKNDTSKEIGHLKNLSDSIFVLSNNHILSISEDQDDKIWFGTRSGVTYYNKKEDDFGFYTQADGLANDMIYSVVCDDNSVWLSTNKGVSLIQKDGDIFNFDVSDGLPGYVFSKGATAMSPSGSIYFGGVAGVAYLNPDSIKYNLHRPDVVLTSIERYHKGKLVERFKGDEEEISIKYKKSSMLKFSFAALDFTEPTKNKFQVYLEGFDDDWRPITSNNELNISDLPVGDYVLHIKGSNSDYVWTNSPIELRISIISPIWMSNYAYAFYLIALVFLVQSIINYRVHHYKSAYKSLQEKAIDKKKIEAQKELLSKINQSLTDSIYYAKRIQESILPSEKKIKNVLPESFIYYRPKDLVSGDFYWLHEADDKIFVAAVDCTGHGVPGAFMSIIAYDMLKSIVGTDTNADPAEILDRLSKEVIATFKKNTPASEQDDLTVNDGMDIALCIIDKKTQKMTFSGAYSPLYLVRDNEIFVYKGDRFPVGYQYDDSLRFSKHEISMEPNDTFYIFSDGYADQFGGSEGKKFKYRRFRHLLLNIHKLPAEDQKAILHQKIEEWMDNYEQVDDMIVIGFKPV